MVVSQFRVVKEFVEEKNITWTPHDVIIFISKKTNIKPANVRDICKQLEVLGLFPNNGLPAQTSGGERGA